MSDWRTSRIFGLTYGEAAWLGAILLLLAYEFWAVATRDGDVLTRAYRANVTRWCAWPIGCGILMGHLHGPVFSGVAGRWSPIIVVVLGAAALARDLLIRTRFDVTYVPALLMLGFFAGVAGWVGRP